MLPEVAGYETRLLLTRLRAYCLPGDDEAARFVRAMKMTQKGEFRLSPTGRWLPFTAEEVIETTISSFRWQARFGRGIHSFTVTDTFEQGHGRLVVKAGGLVPVRKASGPEVDEGELQRYLAEIPTCPPILLNHAGLQWESIGPLTLRVRDRQHSATAVDLDIDENGQPLVARAQRPRMVGKLAVSTPWSGLCHDYQEREGMRLPHRLEAQWHLAEEVFTYIRVELTSVAIIR